jgi:hypothetical protein
MKKLFLSVVAIAFIAGSTLTTFGQVPDKQAVKARENLKEEKKDVVIAKQELKVAKQDSLSEYQQLSKESAIKLKSNEKSIADLRTAITTKNSSAQAEDQKKVSLLEVKNNGLRKELADYKVEGTIKFTAFKSEYNKDLDDLAKELKDFKVL